MSTQTERMLPTLQELRDNGESDPEASLIFQALGAASVCWEKMEGTGVFNSDRAKRIGDELLFELGSRSLAQPPRSDLIDAAKAVVERWDSPLWKDLPHTGEFINRLRVALAAHPKDPAPTVDDLMDVVKEWGERYHYEGYLSDLRTRLKTLFP